MISKIKFTALFLFLFSSSGALAAPNGGTVIQGDVNISTDNTVINQNSDKAIINWDSFDINAGETVTFNQKSNSSVVLNRVTDGNPTNILGSLKANGNVFIVNKSGIVVGNGASINVGGLLATTADITDNDFMNNNFLFSGATTNVSNAGTINISNGGYAVLMGRKVINSGTITAKLGAIQLASGTDFRLTFGGNDLIGVNVETGNTDAETINSGDINADGSLVVMTSKGVTDILTNSVNNTGVIHAGVIDNKNGEIKLIADGGSVLSNGNVSGTKVEISAVNGNVDISDMTVAGSVNIKALEKIKTVMTAGSVNLKTSGTVGAAIDATMTAGSVHIETSGTINATLEGTSDIFAQSSGTGAINITNANTSDVFINGLKSGGEVNYTQTGGRNLSFDPTNVSSGVALVLTNATGTINSDFDFFSGNPNVTFVANRVNLTKNGDDIVVLNSGFIPRLTTKNLSVTASGGIEFADPFSKSDLALTLISSKGAVKSDNLLTLSSLNVTALGDISLETTLERLSAVSSNGNVSVTNTGGMNVSNASAKNGAVSLSALSGNITVLSLSSLNTATIATAAGASVSIQGSGSPLKLALNNGAGTTLQIINNGDMDLSWTNGDFAKLTLKSLGKINLNTDTLKATGDILTQAASLNDGKDMIFHSGGNIILKLESYSKLLVTANNIDITGTDMDLTFTSNITIADLDNDGNSITAGNINIISDNNIVFKDIAQTNNFNVTSGEFMFSGTTSSIFAKNLSITSVRDIYGSGRIYADIANLSGNTVGVAEGSSLLVNAGAGRIEATSLGDGETINITSSSWFTGVKNFNFVTTGTVKLNGKKTDTNFYALIQEADSRNIFPIEETNASELPEYKLLRGYEEKKDLIKFDNTKRIQAQGINIMNGKYNIR